MLRRIEEEHSMGKPLPEPRQREWRDLWGDAGIPPGASEERWR
ncbi:hypothetical protein LILAB_18970 [Corallococcus macrosporus]|uniref:Uncharacterized protein n=2 Tax=Myxococcaceae TaxID=31 RepID=F8C7U5_MYXFH|nr:hypothetical protein LILAB_18970 [Corallococcus macrosporus]